METKAIGDDVLADPLKQRAHLLSLSVTTDGVV